MPMCDWSSDVCSSDLFQSLVGKIPWRRKWQPTLVPLPGKSHGQRSLAGYSPWGLKGSYPGGRRGSFQYYCLENPRDSRAWWAAVYGVAESRTRLKQLSSSSSRECTMAQWKKNPPAMQETWVGKISWRREQLPTPVFWPEEFYGLYSP